MTKVKYYLDETDQIEVDGHTLSRLYLAENPKPDSVSHEAIFGEDNSNRQMGGYIESLANISSDMTGSGYFAWVDEASCVYGNSIVPCGARVIHSTVADSTILANNGNAYVVDSTVKNSTVSEVHESVVADSTCTREVWSSSIYNSSVKSEVSCSTVRNSTLTSTKYSRILHADLNNVTHKGRLSGTFENISEGDISEHTIYCRTPWNTNDSIKLLVGPEGNLALCDVISLPDGQHGVGDTTRDELLDTLRTPLNGKTVGNTKSIALVEQLEAPVLTDDDLDFGDSLER